MHPIHMFSWPHPDNAVPSCRWEKIVSLGKRVRSRRTNDRSSGRTPKGFRPDKRSARQTWTTLFGWMTPHLVTRRGKGWDTSKGR